MASAHSKEAINSMLRLKILSADERTLCVPFNHRQEVNVALQHSRKHGSGVVSLHMVFPEQLVVQPAVHCIWEFLLFFFSCKDKR